MARERCVYAVDQIGDAGRSVNDGLRLRAPEDLMSWLDAVFDHIGLSTVSSVATRTAGGSH
nr:hypothetical protein [Streptoalloteichus hindustanus]